MSGLELDPRRLDLPDEGIVVITDHQTILVAMDGTVVGHLSGYRTELRGLPSDILMFDTDGATYTLGPYGLTPSQPLGSDLQDDAPPFFRWGAPTGCTAIPSASNTYLGTTRIVMCDPTDDPPGWGRFVAIHDGGFREPLFGRPRPSANGSWMWALWNHAGDRLLAQWADPTGDPTAFVIGDDSSPRPSLVGTAEEPMRSTAVGWDTTDAVVAFFPSPPTEMGPAGVYRVPIDGPPILVYATQGHTVEVGMWHFSGRWPAVYIDFPTSGSVVTEGLIEVRGYVTPGSTLRIAHATSVSIDDDGSWTATVELEPGINYLEVIATLDGADGAAEPVTVEYTP